MLLKEIFENEVNEEAYIGLLARIAVGLSYHDDLRNDMDILYEKYKYECYKLAKESLAYSNEFITMGGIVRELYARKALGLILLAERESYVEQELLGLIKKNKPVIYKYINGRRQVELLKLIQKYEDKGPSILRAYEFLVFYLGTKLNKFGQNFFLRFNEVMINIIRVGEADSLNRVDYKELINKSRRFIDEIKNRIAENKGCFAGYEDLFSSSDENIRNYSGIIGAIFDMNKISISALLSEIKLSEEEIDRIILAYMLVYKDKNLERSTNVLINGILIQSMLNMFHDTKKEFFANNKETLYLKLEGVENQIKDFKEEIYRIQEENKTLTQTIENLDTVHQREINKIEKTNKQEVSKLKEIISNKEKVIKGEEVLNREINALREFMFEIKNDYKPEHNEDVKLEEYIKNKKILIVGGTKEWKNKINEKYDNIITIDGFNEKFDIQIVKNTDVIFFFTGYMSHAVYYKIINYLRNNDKVFGYIGKTNIDLVEDEILEQLKILESKIN